MIRVSTIVTTVDNDNGRLITTLARWCDILSTRPWAELIVVNDGGPKGIRLPELWGNASSTVKDRVTFKYLMPPSDDFRLAKSRNDGVRYSRATERIIFTDSDCIPSDNFLDHHLGVPEDGIGVGLRMRVKGEIAQKWIDETSLTCPSENDIQKACYRDDERLDELKPIGWRGCEQVWGCNFSVPIIPFLACGGFDEDIVGWGGEDVNLADRLMRHAKLKFHPLLASRVYHMDHPARSDRSPHPFGRRGQALIANGGPLRRE